MEEALKYSRDYDLQMGNYWHILRNWAELKVHDGLIDEAIEIQTKALEGQLAAVSQSEEGALAPTFARLASMHALSGNQAKADELVERALRMAREYEPKMLLSGTNSVRPISPPLSAFVGFHATDLPSRSARLLGFVDAWIQSNRSRRNLASERMRQESVDRMIARLGPERVEAELQAGRTLSPESAVAYALGETSDPVVSALLEAERVEKSLREGSKPEAPSTESLETLSGTEFTVANAILLLGATLQRTDNGSAEAEDAVNTALRTLVEMDDPILIATCFEVLADIAAGHDSFEESARLCGAALSLRRSAEEAALPCFAGRSRDALGTDAFERHVEEGSKMSIPEAAEYATRGRGLRKRPTSGWASLTPTELRVARLVSEGLTNPQIGERLFISKRTVQAHLHNIFAKLNVSTRSQLTAEVVRRSEPSDNSRK